MTVFGKILISFGLSLVALAYFTPMWSAAPRLGLGAIGALMVLMSANCRR